MIDRAQDTSRPNGLEPGRTPSASWLGSLGRTAQTNVMTCGAVVMFIVSLVILRLG